ncbi:MAG: hypothetical protein WBL50_00115 [Candidatus Acidiferrum sp.]
MATLPVRIPVPKTPKESFNPDRVASSLLRLQALHLQEALAKHVGEIAAVLSINPYKLRTEKELGDYAKKVTAILHPHGSPPRK